MGESDEQFYYPLTDEKRDWSDFTFILPVVAVGNVGQLAVDILLSSLLEKQKCKFVGRFVSDALLPVGGPNAYSLFFKSNEVMTTCQLYECVDHKLVIMQQRAPCFRVSIPKHHYSKTNNS
ncbi:proteasome assembly chaperone 2-like protein [Leptotrombidium deliense]|uniref:Proteasome assembly chaperone 2 n=1 Tax=Leptotrombidium deliense TaxID=299467 RepID=A0A443SW74_9ACAR|nr:proteasome assembly chaperone 2-like protein [Leptotrombidium deliense]